MQIVLTLGHILIIMTMIDAIILSIIMAMVLCLIISRCIFVLYHSVIESIFL